MEAVQTNIQVKIKKKLTLTFRGMKITRVKVKLMTMLCSCVRVSKVLAASHDPEVLTSFGFRFTNDQMV